MNTVNQVRAATRPDVEAMRSILDATLFPGAMLDEMMEPFFADPDGGEFWLVCEAGNEILGLAFCAPEPLTEGAWNLKAIGVRPDRHRSGAGRALMAAVEDRLSACEARLVVVDTSSADEQQGARAFYGSLGYEQEALIRDFWAAGEDKVTFTRRLQPRR